MAIVVEASRREPVLGDYLAVLRRRWPAIGALVLLGIVLAGACYVVFPHSYHASAAVEVTPTGVAEQSGTTNASRAPTGSNVDLDTEAAFVTSTLVAGEARHLLGVHTPLGTLLSRVTVTVPPNSSIMVIGYAARTAQAAQSGANAFADAYLTERAALAQSTLHAQVTSLEKTVLGLAVQIRGLSDALMSLNPTSAAAVNDRIRRGVLQGQLNGLNAALVPLRATVVTPGAIISTAGRPTNPSPRMAYFAVGGLFGGLLIGLIGATILETRDRRIHRARDVERHTGFPVLGTVRFTSRRPGAWSELLRPSSAAGHVVGLAQNVVLAAACSGSRSVLVLPVSGSTSGPAVAAGLTGALARGHGKAVLAAPGYAVSDLRGFVEGVPGVRVVEMPPPASLCPQRLATYIARLAGKARSTPPIVVEGPPMSAGPEAAALAGAADRVLVVVDANRDRYPELRELLHELAVWQAEIAGIVLVRPARGTLASSVEQDKPRRSPASDTPQHVSDTPQHVTVRPPIPLAAGHAARTATPATGRPAVEPTPITRRAGRRRPATQPAPQAAPTRRRVAV